MVREPAVLTVVGVYIAIKSALRRFVKLAARFTEDKLVIANGLFVRNKNRRNIGVPGNR